MTPSESQSQDFEWYKRNLLDLFQRFGYVVVAIKNKNVLGCYGSYSEAIHETAKTEKLGTFIVQQLGPDKSAYTVYIN